MILLALDRHFLSRERAFQVARIGTAGLFLAHAVVRVVDDTIPQFAGFMASQGFPWSGFGCPAPAPPWP